ncbi:tyrosine-protein phosphatase [Christiangramia flava]|uniref:protein-tyrosine-phosphatase n=1 Tax=Christiangramia flava JLT2011 TaxID=1229726 RepID=A0A1L7I0S0_9FLAO|nr:CpsB/CapC family capsule biosynthesis tyrosine phosphatase [Christiangramia flava]APU66794.1 Capsular polysaccharide synthesis enzyme Cap8C [Christiangramia flava JLT2011]OSS38431.1 Manganese-dependent protein-tyrosine phosphatase [Christiangramia flava JLT2011]
MFSIFRKNSYLIDLLEGITDFHNHILPGLDDGAKNIEESLQLIEQFRSFGIEKIVCTPHVMGDYYPNTQETIHSALAEVRSQTEISVNASAEYMMDQHFMEIIEQQEILPVVGKKVLVEMSYFQAPINLNEILFRLQNHSYSPILAHPERYAYYHHKFSQYEDLKTRGCKFQLNMLSLSGHYGTGIQKTAFLLLEKGMLDYISSDAHRMDHLEKLKKIKIKTKHEDLIKVLVDNNKKLFA